MTTKIKKLHSQSDFESCKNLLYKIIEDKLRISKEKLLSIDKTRDVADVRRVVVNLLKGNFPNAKIAVLGQVVGRDHSNTSQQIKKHHELYHSNHSYTSLFNEINEEFLKNSFVLKNSINNLNETKNNLETTLEVVNSIIKDLKIKKKPNKKA